MEIAWKSEFDVDQFVIFHYTCKPYINKGILYYAFPTTDYESGKIDGFFGKKINIYEFNKTTGEYLKKYICLNRGNTKGNEILIPQKWKFSKKRKKLYLYVGILLDIVENKISDDDINLIQDEEIIKSEFVIGDFLVKYNQLSTLECFLKSTKEQIWKVKIKGYLYTKLELKDNCLIFGTAGRGGAFYCVDIETGKILTEINNGDSSNYEWFEKTILIKDKKGNLQQINPFSNEIIEVLPLKEKMLNAPIVVDNNNIYTTVHNKRRNLANLICITT